MNKEIFDALTDAVDAITKVARLCAQENPEPKPDTLEEGDFVETTDTDGRPVRGAIYFLGGHWHCCAWSPPTTTVKIDPANVRILAKGKAT